MYWPKNEETTDLEKGETVTLRYRVIIHRGDHIEANIAKLFEKFGNE
jgi:hypothetical protein